MRGLAVRCGSPLDGARRELPLRAQPRGSRCLMLRPKPGVRSGGGFPLLNILLAIGKLLRAMAICDLKGPSWVPPGIAQSVKALAAQYPRRLIHVSEKQADANHSGRASS